jgi:hypothetical protein
VDPDCLEEFRIFVKVKYKLGVVLLHLQSLANSVQLGFQTLYLLFDLSFFFLKSLVDLVVGVAFDLVYEALQSVKDGG